MGMRYYILNDLGEPACTHSEEEYSTYILERFDRHRVVGRDEIKMDCPPDSTFVETIFIAMNADPDGPCPLYWQTWICGGPLDGNYFHCAGSREQAEAMHQQTVEAVKEQYEAIRQAWNGTTH